ncbi:unnamed protein product, partial [marine sediment metagenome]
MVVIMAQGGAVLTRPTGGVLATDCITHCSPCITTDQDDAGLSIAGGCLGNPFYQSGLIEMAPGTLLWSGAWEGPTWAGDCCWVWANYVDISEWTAPEWICNWVLIICYDGATDTYDAASDYRGQAYRARLAAGPHGQGGALDAGGVGEEVNPLVAAGGVEQLVDALGLSDADFDSERSAAAQVLGRAGDDGTDELQSRGTGANGLVRLALHLLR